MPAGGNTSLLKYLFMGEDDRGSCKGKYRVTNSNTVVAPGLRRCACIQVVVGAWAHRRGGGRPQGASTGA